MGFSLGIVGLPNVGKSTLFSALSHNQVDIQNYPFTTIKPNVGIVAVPDERLAFIHKNLQSAKAVPTTIEFFDIAGLVKGAHKGEGLGNQFLSQIRNVDAIAHVVRCFKSEQITHVSGTLQPIKDIELIEAELILADLALVEKKRLDLKSRAKTGDKKMLSELDICEKLVKHLGEGHLAIQFNFPDNMEDLKIALPLLTFKPVLYVANVDESGNIEMVEKIKEFAAPKGFFVVSICSKLELELGDMDQDDAEEYRKSSGVDKNGLGALISVGYKLLDLITFFTSNNKESHAWTIKRGATVQKSAGKIHSDMENNFIAAEVIHFNDFSIFSKIELLKQKGLVHLEGRDYIMCDGDIVYIRFS